MKVERGTFRSRKRALTIRAIDSYCKGKRELVEEKGAGVKAIGALVRDEMGEETHFLCKRGTYWVLGKVCVWGGGGGAAPTPNCPRASPLQRSELS